MALDWVALAATAASSAASGSRDFRRNGDPVPDLITGRVAAATASFAESGAAAGLRRDATEGSAAVPTDDGLGGAGALSSAGGGLDLRRATTAGTGGREGFGGGVASSVVAFSPPLADDVAADVVVVVAVRLLTTGGTEPAGGSEGFFGPSIEAARFRAAMGGAPFPASPRGAATGARFFRGGGSAPVFFPRNDIRGPLGCRREDQPTCRQQKWMVKINVSCPIFREILVL